MPIETSAKRYTAKIQELFARVTRATIARVILALQYEVRWTLKAAHTKANQEQADRESQSVTREITPHQPANGCSQGVPTSTERGAQST